MLVLAAAVYFVALGNAAIWDANEAFYVETPREMLESGDYVNPSFNYEPRFNKPVLSYWIVVALYKAFWVSVGVQRFGIAIGAMAIIACAFVIARAAGGRAAGLWAAVALAAAPRLVMFARRIFIDIWITAFLAATLACFALSERYPDRRRLFLILMYVAIGLGVLTKGPVAIALPALAFGLYLAVSRELRRAAHMMIPLGVLIIAVIVVPWYALLYREHGSTYITSFLVAENLERFTQGLGVRQERGWWFYLPVVFSDAFPASALLFAAAASWKRRTRVETILWCWIGAIVVFFSLSAGKQDLYIFPIIPAVAALAGIAIDRGLTGALSRRWLTGTFAVAGAVLAAAGAAVLALFVTAGRVYALDSALIVGALGLAGGLASLALALARRPAASAMALFAALVAVNWAFVLRVLPEFERYKPVPVFSAALSDRLQPDDVVANYKVALPSMVYYLRRHVDEYFDAASFVGAVASPKTMYAVLSSQDYAALAPQIGSRTCVLDRRPTFEVKLKQVLTREPLPELLLITNRCAQ